MISFFCACILFPSPKILVSLTSLSIHYHNTFFKILNYFHKYYFYINSFVAKMFNTDVGPLNYFCG